MELDADDKEKITNLGEWTRALNTRTDKMQTWSINPNSSKYLGQERIYGCFFRTLIPAATWKADLGKGWFRDREAQ